MHDVLVIGGGPGGLYSAALLARQGHDVLLVEEHGHAGQPVHCTGVLAVEAFDEFDVPRDSILNRLSTARFHAPSGLTISYTTPTTEALVIDRAVFDAGLYDRAVAAGVDVRLGTRITGLEMTDFGVVATSEQGVFAARTCVLACGANYALHRRLGLGLPTVFLRSAQLELKAERTGDVEVHFGHDVAPKGFAWVVPVDRDGEPYARVGLMGESDAATCFRRFVTRVAPRWGLAYGGDQAMAPRQKMLPLAPLSKTYTDRVLAVGDAAGLVKATTGGGIYYSLVSADLAARVLGDALRRDQLGARTLREYERQWRQRLGPELDAQLSLREAAEAMEDEDIDGMFDLARTNGVMPIIRQTARFNRHRELISALFKHAPARRLLLKAFVSRVAALPAR
ncbi:MAG: NAD(P)/FAD-dependent oxidoreductase [Vicinamibacterales bacterium]